MQKVEKGGGGKALSEMSCEFKEDVYIRPFFTTFMMTTNGGLVQMCFLFNLLDFYLPYKSRWWFQIFFIFTPAWGRFPL